jgi:hypothetical protein
LKQGKQKIDRASKGFYDFGWKDRDRLSGDDAVGAGVSGPAWLQKKYFANAMEMP